MKLLKFVLLSAVAPMMVACGGPFPAPYQSEIAPIDDIEFPWPGCRLDPFTGQKIQPSCEDPEPMILRIDMLVRNIDSLIGYNNVRVSFNTSYHDIYVLPPEVIQAVDTPSSSSGWNSIDSSEVWAEFSGTLDGDYAPTYGQTATNNAGVASAFLWVQSLPADESGAVKGAVMYVSTGNDYMKVKLKPES